MIKVEINVEGKVCPPMKNRLSSDKVFVLFPPSLVWTVAMTVIIKFPLILLLVKWYKHFHYELYDQKKKIERKQTTWGKCDLYLKNKEPSSLEKRMKITSFQKLGLSWFKFSIHSFSFSKFFLGTEMFKSWTSSIGAHQSDAHVIFRFICFIQS